LVLVSWEVLNDGDDILIVILKVILTLATTAFRVFGRLHYT